MKNALVFIPLLTLLNLSAQSVIQNVFSSNKIVVESFLQNSSMLVKRGELSMDLSNSIELERTFWKVSDSGSFFKIHANFRIIRDSIVSGSESYIFSSDQGSDTGSMLTKYATMISADTARYLVNSNGEILNSSNPTRLDLNDKSLLLADLTGLLDKSIVQGDHFPMILPFAFDTSTALGSGWLMEDVISNRVTKSTYTLTSRQNGYSYISYSQKISDNLTNVNVNGSMVVENASGMITECDSKSAAAGYLTVNGLTLKFEKYTSTYQSFSFRTSGK